LIKKLSAGAIALAICLAPQMYSHHINEHNGIRRVLLLSIDGMHAVDYLNCVSGGYCPNLAALGTTGVNYTRTSTSKPSGSAPGLMALVTGGTPRLVGVFYDVAFDRVLAPPLNDTGNGVFSGTCTPNTPNGTTRPDSGSAGFCPVGAGKPLCLFAPRRKRAGAAPCRSTRIEMYRLPESP
jgi:hypothetical protein